MIREIERVLPPGGWGYLSWTNWYSPHGGHDMSPYHLLGPRARPAPLRAPARAAAQEPLRRGPVPRAHRPDAALRPQPAGLRVAARGAALLAAAGVPHRIPGVREVACWNCVIHVERRARSRCARRPSTRAGLADRRAGRAPARRGRAARPPAAGSSRSAPTTAARRSCWRPRRPRPRRSSRSTRTPGNDRGPQQWTGTAAEGEADNAAFLANLERARRGGPRAPRAPALAGRARRGRGRRRRPVRRRRAPVRARARADISRWGARVAPGGTLLIHDAFSSVGVTLAILRTCSAAAASATSGAAARSPSTGARTSHAAARAATAAAQLASLPWFARNLVVKAALVGAAPRRRACARPPVRAMAVLRRPRRAFPLLDSVRAIAALSVLVFHASLWSQITLTGSAQRRSWRGSTSA